MEDRAAMVRVAVLCRLLAEALDELEAEIAPVVNLVQYDEDGESPFVGLLLVEAA